MLINVDFGDVISFFSLYVMACLRRYFKHLRNCFIRKHFLSAISKNAAMLLAQWALKKKPEASENS